MRTHLSSGNLVRLAMSPGWEGAAAGALLGLDSDRFEALSETPGHVAAFYLAVGYWMRGDEDKAIGRLEGLTDLDCAARLLGLIRQPRIEVLSFFPDRSRQPHLLGDAGRYDAKFILHNVSFDAGDRCNLPDADVRRFYDPARIPDFLIAEMVEWHVLPRNLQDFPAPLIGHTSDFDLYPQTVPSYLRLFDVMLTVGDTEWRAAQKLLPSERCMLFPAMVALDSSSPLTQTPRPLDFLQTNTVFSPIHRDKEAVLKRVIETPGLNYFLHNGALNEQTYQRLMESCKLTLSYIRNSESIPSRAIESLAAGACCLIPADSVLHLYVPPGHGLVIVDQNDTMAVQRAVQAVTRHQVERYRLEAERGARRVREVFSAARVGSQYLRFCTVLAALSIRGPRMTPPATQARPIVAIGPLPSGGRRDVLDALRESNDRLAAAQSGPIYRRLNDRARNALIDYNLFARFTRQPLDDALARQAVDLFGQAVANAPDALAPAFNFVRAAFHFGTPADRDRAEALAREVIARSPESWALDLADDLLPYDFMPSFADTRRLMTALLDWTSGDLAARDRVVSIVLAAVHFYLGWRTGEVGWFAKSLALNPDFSEARLAYCHALLDSGGPADAALAVAALEQFAESHVRMGEFNPLLARARRQAGLAEDTPPSQVEAATIDMMGDYYSDFPVLARAMRRYFAETEDRVHRYAPEGREISLIVADRHRRCQPHLAGMSWGPARETIEVIHVDRYARPDASSPYWCDVALQELAVPEIVDHLGRTLTKGFHQASGDRLVFAQDLEGVAAETILRAIEIIGRQDGGGIILGNTPAPQWMAVTRRDFISLGGFDHSIACQGPRGGLREFIWRARNAGMLIFELSESSVHPPPWLGDFSLLADSGTVASMAIELSTSPRWLDASRIAPLWPDPTVKALATALGL